jgi:putative two-component system response regulator
MKQVLVVDDDLSMLKQLSAYLSGEYEVSLAKSGLLALQICMEERPDLILLDIEMPGMNGFDLMSRIRQIPCLCRIPVIFLTIFRDAATEARALEAGAWDFITKPVEKRVLLHRIAMHLRLSSYRVKTEAAVATLSDSIAVSFVELIECGDEDPNGHVERSSRLVDFLGRALIKKGCFAAELTPVELRLIIRATPLHDIGKIAISDRVLLKTGRLDDEEFVIVKRHAAIGGEILERMYRRAPIQHYLYYASLAAATHHERWDGKGYPKGLAGDDIPLCGRIMAVADVYDALMDNRVYRHSMGQAQAYDIIIGGKGTQFDPCVVDAFKSIRHELAGLYASSGV